MTIHQQEIAKIEAKGTRAGEEGERYKQSKSSSLALTSRLSRVAYQMEGDEHVTCMRRPPPRVSRRPMVIGHASGGSPVTK